MQPIFGVALALLAAPVCLVANDSGALEVKPAVDYTSHQSRDGITIAAEPYERGEKVKIAFNEVDPYQYGFLPVLLVISNDSDAILRLDKLRVQFVRSNRQAYEPTAAADVARYRADRRRWGRAGAHVSFPWGGSKGPLEAWEIPAREFTASFVSPHASASGFFYFWTGAGRDPIPGATVYVTGLADGRSGKDLMFFEVDLEPYNLERRQERAQPARSNREQLKVVRYR
jgi:hypothetical protein